MFSEKSLEIKKKNTSGLDVLNCRNFPILTISFINWTFQKKTPTYVIGVAKLFTTNITTDSDSTFAYGYTVKPLYCNNLRITSQSFGLIFCNIYH